jgi:hypothetical protein
MAGLYSPFSGSVDYHIPEDHCSRPGCEQDQEREVRLAG